MASLAPKPHGLDMTFTVPSPKSQLEEGFTQQDPH